MQTINPSSDHDLNKEIHIKLYEELRTKDTQYLFIFGRKKLSSTCEKSDKNNLRIISKQYAHLKDHESFKGIAMKL